MRPSFRSALAVCLVGFTVLLGCDEVETYFEVPTAPPQDSLSRPPASTTSASTAELDSAIAEGLPATLQRRSLIELLTLVDAAQKESNLDVAYQALRAVRERFPRTPDAMGAAYTLGEITEGADPRQAAEWYARYLAEAPNGPRAVAAIGRQMMLLAEQDDPKAEDLATTYLDRAPEGEYASEARQLLAH